jgi:triacylglycerol lipase
MPTPTRDSAAPIGVLPHLMRLARKVVSTRGALGLIREARGIGTHIVHYPTGLRRVPVRPNGLGTEDGMFYSTPVVLLHGYFHNRSGFDFMSRELRSRGFRWIHGLNYNPLGNGVPDLAESFARTVEDIRKVSGSKRVHVVGHSLGGVIVRWYIQELGGAKLVDRCITIGTPHNGTLAAYLGIGQAARDMRPGSPILERLELGLPRTKTKIVKLYSDLDVLIIPSSSAVLPERKNVTNLLIEDLGHTSLLLSQALTDEVCDLLEGAEKPLRVPSAREIGETA